MRSNHSWQKRIKRNHRHTKGLGTFGNRLANVAKRNDPHGPPAQPVHRLPALPFPDTLMGCPIIVGQFAHKRQA
jgi:hypothetical protein